jgi:hypothetical protein
MSRTRFFLQPDGKVVSDQTVNVRKSELDALIEKANRAEADLKQLRNDAELLPISDASNKVLTAHRNALEKEVERLNDALAKEQAARREEESWWKEKHDYKERAEKAEARLHWLHDCSNGTTDADGYEWGIYRVKWVNGQAIEVLATLSDFSDLDAEMEREAQARYSLAKGINQ